MFLDPLSVEVEDKEGNGKWISFELPPGGDPTQPWEDPFMKHEVSQLIKMIAETPSVPLASVIPLGPVDLEASVVLSPRFPQDDPQCFKHFVVTNNGTGAALMQPDAVLAEIGTSQDPPMTVFADRFPAIMPGRSLDLEQYGHGETNVRYVLTVDPNNVIAETDETNNRATYVRPPCEFVPIR
jgi:hypothetical protein